MAGKKVHSWAPARSDVRHCLGHPVSAGSLKEVSTVTIFICAQIFSPTSRTTLNVRDWECKNLLHNKIDVEFGKTKSDYPPMSINVHIRCDKVQIRKNLVNKKAIRIIAPCPVSDLSVWVYKLNLLRITRSTTSLIVIIAQKSKKSLCQNWNKQNVSKWHSLKKWHCNWDSHEHKMKEPREQNNIKINQL